MTTGLGGVHVDVTMSLQDLGRGLADDMGRAARQAARDSDRDFRAAGQASARSFTEQFGAYFARSFAQLLGRSGQTAGQQLADGITRGADGRLRDARGRFIDEGTSAGAGFTRGFSRGLNLGGGLGSAVLSSLGTITRLTAVLGASVAAGGLIGLASPAVLAGVAALAAELTQVVGVLGLVPAAVTGAALAVSTLVIGFQGIGDALSAETPAEFSEALKNLAPNARDAAVAVKSFADEARGLRLSVQDALFAGMADVLQQLGRTYLPLAQRGFTGLATEINSVARAFADFALQPQTIADAGSIFADLQLAIRAAAPGVTSFASAFRDIIAVGAQFLPELAARFSELGQRFADFIAGARESGALNQFFRDAIDAARDLLAIVGNLGSGIGAVFRAANASGTDVLGTLRSMTEGLSDFLASTAGQEGLTSFFTAAREAAAALQPVLLAVFDLIANTIAPLLADLGTTIAPGVTAAINAIGVALATAAPGLEVLASGITAFLIAMAPAAESVGRLASAIGGTLGQVLTRIGPVLSRTVSVLADGLAEAINQPALIDGLVAIAESFAYLAEAIAPVLPDLGRLAGDVLSALADILRPLIDMFIELTPVLEPVFDAFVFLLEVLEPILEVVGFLISALGDLIDILKEVIDFSADALDAALTLVTGVARETSFTGTTVTQFATDSELAFARFRDAAGTAGESMAEFAAGTVGAIGTAVAATQAGAAQMNTAVVEGLRGIARAGFEAFSALTNAARRELEATRAAAANAMREIAGVIRSQNFSAAGAGLIRSLADGMVSDAALAAVRAAARRAVEAIAAFLPRSPAQEGPFSGRGWTPFRGAALVEGFAAGILARLALVTSAAARLAQAADFSVLPYPGVAVRPGGGALVSPVAARPAVAAANSRVLNLNQYVQVPSTDPAAYAAVTGVHLRAAASKVM